MCYDDPGSIRYSSTDPFCIPRDQFCDGISDCGNGRDEKKLGFGFKCQIKHQQDACILSPLMVYDNVTDCSNGDDYFGSALEAVIK